MNPEHLQNLEKLYHEKAIAVNRLYKREHVGEDVKRERIQAEMDLKAVGLFVPPIKTVVFGIPPFWWVLIVLFTSLTGIVFVFYLMDERSKQWVRR